MPVIDPNAVRNRIVERKRVKARDLLLNPANWRTHPDTQSGAVKGLLNEIGQFDALLAYYSKRNGGKLTLVNGHLRRDLDPELEWDVEVADFTDEEADKVLLLLDPLTALAGMDGQKLADLAERARTDDLYVREVILDLERAALNQPEEDEADLRDETGPPAMELLPFEHYDYVLLCFKNELDWAAACDLLGLERRSNPLNRKSKRIGLARAIDGATVLALLRKAKGEAA